MVSDLRVQLLGEFDLTYDGRRVTAIHAPRLRLLLTYLILHRNIPQLRQHLAFSLWPDSSEAQARTNLRNLVHLLRQALPHSECCLHAEGQILMWAPRIPCTLDTVEFEAAIKTGALQDAVSLYHGELLPECYSDWVAPERERLRQLYVAALEHLADQMEAARDYGAALDYAQRLAREDPLCEAHCRRVIRLQMLAGDRAAALRTYHACATVLRSELGVEPAPATQQLHAQLLRGCTAAAETSSPAPEASYPLVGRRQEWAALLKAWQGAACGQPHLILITGDVGIGKTRLAEELLAWARRQGYPAAQATCYTAEGCLPYSGLVTWLRSRPLPALPAPWRGELATLLSDAPADRRKLDAAWGRHRLFEAAARAVLAWGRTGDPLAGPLPALLVLDDAQWCDQDTLDWLHFLLRFDPQGRVLVIATARAGDPAADQALAPLLASLRRHNMVTEIELDPLNCAETHALASRVVGLPLAENLAAPLHQGAEGNPLFIVEMARAGLGRSAPPDLQQHAAQMLAAGQRLPSKIQQVLAARLAQLSPTALALAELVAVTGRPCHYARLARAFDGGEADLVQALDELWRRRIVREAGSDSYEFTHEKLREACLDGMSPARRRMAQRRMAEAGAER